MRLLKTLKWKNEDINFSSITVNRKEKLNGNSMSIIIENPNDVFVDNKIKFAVGDGIELYAKNDYTGSTLDTTASSDDLLFNGIIKSMKIKTGIKFRFTLECIDKTYDVLNSLWSKNYNEMTAPEIIYNVMQFSAYNGTDYDIDIAYDNTSPYTEGIQNLRPDGTAFPTKSYGNAHKPVFEFIEDLSQLEYTNTEDELNGTNVCKRPFTYYIDRYNKFHWFYPTDTPSYELQFGATAAIGTDTKYHRIIEDDLEFSQFGEINFIIFKAGEDMDNVQILDFDLDPTAESLNKADCFKAWEFISRNMKREDKANLTYVSQDNYDYPSSYSVTPKWDSQARAVSTDSDYNDNFREEAIKRAKNKAKGLFSETGDPRWKAKITLRGEEFDPTDLIKYTHNEYGFTNLLMRIKSVTHNIDKSSFTTVLSVEEDITEVK